MRDFSIVHIDTQMSWRGGERQALELMKGLSRLGHRNVLICKESSEISRRALNAGIDVVHLPLKGEWDVLSAYRIRAYVKKEGIDIVHAHTSHAHTLGLMAVCGLSSCKLVVSRRVDFHVDGYLSRKLKYGGAVDRIITVSDAVKRVLVEDGVDKARIETIRSGFITGEFTGEYTRDDLRRELGIPGGAVVIATVAALVPHKSHNDLLKAAHLVVRKHPEVLFLLAGEGELRASIEKNIVNLGLEKSVILLGFVEDIEKVYRAADIFAISSREEGLCTSILDAMYFGLPVVATSAGGIPELVQDEVNGLIVPVGDYMQFAEKLEYLIENPERRSVMGARSKEILERNKMENTIENTLRVYRTIWENE